MHTLVGKLNDFMERWVRKRFVLPFLIVLATAMLVVSEDTYHDTTSTLRGGIELTDARIQSLRLHQLLSDAETAQYGFLVTGQDEYLARYAGVKAELPELQLAVAGFFSSRDAESSATIQRLADLTRRKLARIDRTLELARAGQSVAAADLASDEPGRAEMLALREALSRHFARAATLQQQARTSIYDALLVNRLVLGSLTLVTLLSLFLFIRQLQLQDRTHSRQQAALLDERERLEVQVIRRTARLTELARHLQTVREDERTRIARELHDELGALLTVTKLEIARARSKVGEPAEMLVRLERVSEYLNKGIALKRRIIEDLTPSALSQLGLSVALENLCQDMSASLAIPVRLTLADFHLSPEAALAVYRFVQEALTNIGKYASARQVEVTLQVVDSLAAVEVHDDGVGFDPSSERVGHHGLSGMQFRAESLGGSMRVSSAPGEGTSVRIEFPQSRPETSAA